MCVCVFVSDLLHAAWHRCSSLYVALTFISPSACCTVHNMHSGEQQRGQLTAATKQHFILLKVTARPKQTDTPLGINPLPVTAPVWMLQSVSDSFRARR